MNAHVFHFNADVNEKTTSVLRDQILTAKNRHCADALFLLLSSPGGRLNAGFSTYNFLRSLKIPITTVNTGCVESIATILYLAGDQRISVDNARFLLHEFDWTFDAGSINHSRLREHVESLDFDAERYAQIFKERTAAAKNLIDIDKCLHGSHLTLDASAAMDAGIAQTVCAPDQITMPTDAVHWWVNVF